MSKQNNFYPNAWSLDFFAQDHDQFLHDLIRQIKQVETTGTVILFCIEWQPMQHILHAIDRITTECGHRIVWMLTDSFYQDDQQQQIKDTGIDINFIEFDILTLYFELNVYKSSVLNQQWNPAAGKFLFLTGKPHRSNRIRLLHKFYKNNLLDQCTWSFFMDDNLRQLSRQLLPELSDQAYNNFVDAHVRTPDDIKVLYGSGGSCHCDGYPFDTDLYRHTSFRVIAETQMFNQHIVTEKTWVTIANRQPFIMAGYQHNLQCLKKIGYKTFENFLKIDHYDSISDAETRLDAVVENTRHWLDSLPRDQDLIAQDIEHNYQLLMTQMDKTVDTFHNIYTKLGTTEYPIFMIIPSGVQKSTWLNFYYGIKDPTWPDCFNEHEFDSLPVEIQRECVEVYGYKINN